MPAAAFAAALSVVAAGAVFPLFDLTPLVVLGIAWVTRRWNTRAARWFWAAKILSAIMVVEWIVWDSWFVGTILGSTSRVSDSSIGELVNQLSRLYAVELGALLTVFAAASVLAILGLRGQTPLESRDDRQYDGLRDRA